MNRLLTACAILITTLSSSSGVATATDFGQGIKKEIRIGILDRDVDSSTKTKWSPTVRYLEEELPGYNILMVELQPRDIRKGDLDEYLDLLIIDPAGYVLTTMRRQLIPLATMTQIRMGVGLAENGGVIFTRNGNRALKSIDDLIGKSFLATGEDDFFAWQTVYRELVTRRVAPHEDLKPLEFIGNEELVVLGVLEGKAEAGAVSLGVLEEMALLGKIGLDSYRVLGPRLSDDPFERTTTTYPGWVCAAFLHMAPGVAGHLAKVLMAMPSGHPAAIAVRSAGWTEAGDYQKVHDCLSMVKLADYGDRAEADWLEVALIFALPLLSVLCILATYLILSMKIRKLQWELSRVKSLTPSPPAKTAAEMPGDLVEEMENLSDEQVDPVDPPPSGDSTEPTSLSEQDEAEAVADPSMDTGDNPTAAAEDVTAAEPEVNPIATAAETSAAPEESPVATAEETPATAEVVAPIPDEPADVEDLNDIVAE